MLVTRVDPRTGVTNQMEINVDPGLLALYEADSLDNVPDAFPHLTPSEREFIMTGMTDETWEKLVG